MRNLKIGKNEAGQRMDKFLKKYFKEAGSGFLYKMLRKKNILLNGKKAEGKEMLVQGDQITLYLAEETIDKFRGIPERAAEHSVKNPYPVRKLDIVYEDEDVLFLNKPAGILSQKAQPQDVSMVEYVIGYLLEQGKISREQLETFHPSVCNRLDRNTSGLILAGKTLPGLQMLSRKLKNRDMEKNYLCLVKGSVRQGRHCKGYLVKNRASNQVRISQKPVEGGEYIETRYQPLWRDEECSLLKVELITGKSHQIRSHLASLGYPLAGDPKYGDPLWNREWKKRTGLNRQFLHAWEICFPEDEKECSSINGKTYDAPVPSDLKKVLEWKGCTMDI